MEKRYQVIKTGFNVFEVRDRDGITIYEGSEEDCRNYVQSVTWKKGI
jgi:hypothetical protein